MRTIAHRDLDAAHPRSDDPADVAQQRYDALVRNGFEVVYLTDRKGKILWINPPVAGLLGYQPEELIGRNFRSIVHPDDLDRAVQVHQLVASEKDGPRRLTLRLLHRDGGWRWVDSVKANHLDTAPLHSIVTNIRDVTDEHDARARLERLGRVLEATPDLVLITGVDGQVDFVNAAARSFFGLGRHGGLPTVDDEDTGDALDLADAAGAPLADVDVHGLLMESLGDRWEREALPSLQTRGFWQGEVWLSQPGHSLVPLSMVLLAHHDTWGRIDSFSAIARDQSSRRSLQTELARLENHDALTTLPNRKLLLDRLDAILSSPREDDDSVGVLFCDLDQFRVVNDSLGHHVGDEVLAEVGERLLAVARADDLVARFGGDEFVLVRDHVHSVEELTDLASAVNHTIARPYRLDGGETVITASVGVTRSTPMSRNGNALLRDADAAMHVAKERGRNRFELFDSRIRSRVLRRIGIERELRAALTDHQLRVHYQAAIDLNTGAPCGVEALVRWNHPERGLLLPGEFLSIAEETGLVVPLGSWVLRTALREIRSLQGPFGGGDQLQVSVNLSTRQLDKAFLVEEVAALLRDTAIPPETVTLELTEHVLMGDVEGRVARLKDLGVRLAVDDFGTGYASLSYLKRFPVDEVKIDHAFVTGLGSDPHDLAITGAVIRLAHDLGMYTTAEGVESAEQLEALRRLGCDRAQGFLMARPMPLEDLRVLLDQTMTRDTRTPQHPAAQQPAAEQPAPQPAQFAR